jgi:K+-sensing histidine kinase KdpD
MNAIRRRPRDPDVAASLVLTAIGVLGALALSVAMIPLRDHLHNDNMALVLVLPVLVAAVVGGRRAGAATAVTAALCFDFFFTRPYLTLRIASGNDVASMVALLAVALVSAEVGIRARRGGRSARSASEDLERLCRVIELAARTDVVEDVVSSVRAELIGLLGLDDCTFSTAAPDSQHPHLGIHGAIEAMPLVATQGDFVLPAGVVELEVAGRDHHYGSLVLFVGEPVRAPLQKRVVAVALADQLGLTLAAAGGSPSNR